MKKRLTGAKSKESESEAWSMALELIETRSLLPVLRKSYRLSRFWIWLGQIEIHPKVRIPAPKFLTHYDL